jgi:hypothetical protein
MPMSTNFAAPEASAVSHRPLVLFATRRPPAAGLPCYDLGLPLISVNHVTVGHPPAPAAQTR